jgi:hypothetical protein
MMNSRLLFLVRLSTFTTSTKYCGFSLLEASKGLLLVRVAPDFPPASSDEFLGELGKTFPRKTKSSQLFMP